MQLKFALILCVLIALLISTAQAGHVTKRSKKSSPKTTIPSFVGKLLQKKSML